MKIGHKVDCTDNEKYLITTKLAKCKRTLEIIKMSRTLKERIRKLEIKLELSGTENGFGLKTIKST